MSVVLELPPELETQLSEEAARLRLPLAEYAVRLLATGRTSGPKPNNGAELLAYWQSAGLIGTRTDIPDAQGHSRILRQQAEKRERS